jgi:hypothetical protein
MINAERRTSLLVRSNCAPRDGSTNQPSEFAL